MIPRAPALSSDEQPEVMKVWFSQASGDGELLIEKPRTGRNAKDCYKRQSRGTL